MAVCSQLQLGKPAVVVSSLRAWTRVNSGTQRESREHYIYRWQRSLLEARWLSCKGALLTASFLHSCAEYEVPASLRTIQSVTATTSHENAIRTCQRDLACCGFKEGSFEFGVDENGRAYIDETTATGTCRMLVYLVWQEPWNSLCPDLNSCDSASPKA